MFSLPMSFINDYPTSNLGQNSSFVRTYAL